MKLPFAHAFPTQQAEVRKEIFFFFNSVLGGRGGVQKALENK